MKKRRVDFDGVGDRMSLYSIWLAHEAEFGMLATRLRQGRASREEMALAADLIEKKIKPRRTKSSRIQDYFIASHIKMLKEFFPKWQRKRIVSETIDFFNHYKFISKSRVYDVLADFDDKTLDKIERMARGTLPSEDAKTLDKIERMARDILLGESEAKILDKIERMARGTLPSEDAKARDILLSESDTKILDKIKLMARGILPRK
jgi:hypothetical protein